MCDQRVRLNGYYAQKHYPEHLRRIRYHDPDSGKTLVFLTNNTALEAATICALYKCRWKIELFFENTTWCTPSYVIEFRRAVGLNRSLMGVLRGFLFLCVARRLLSAVSMERSHRLA